MLSHCVTQCFPCCVSLSCVRLRLNMRSHCVTQCFSCCVSLPCSALRPPASQCAPGLSDATGTTQRNVSHIAFLLHRRPDDGRLTTEACCLNEYNIRLPVTRILIRQLCLTILSECIFRKECPTSIL